MSRIRNAVAALALACTSMTASADVFRLDLEGLPLLPFGGEYLLGFLMKGEVTSVEIELTFTPSGAFQAENFVFTLGAPTGGVTIFAASQWGWSGQGTFTGSLTTDNFDGVILPEGPLSTWFMNIAPTLDSLPTPVTGELGPSFITIDTILCADLNNDDAVDSLDLLAYLEDWFAGNADRTSDGATDALDLLEFLEGWFNPCACNLC